MIGALHTCSIHGHWNETPENNGANSRCPDCLIEERHAFVLPREAINHPAHYGGADNPYEAIKVIEAWGLGFHLGNAVKYISRAGKKGDALQDLQKARWYLDREIERQQRKSNGE